MRKLAVLAVVALAAVVVGAAFAKQNWSVHLTPEQEVQPGVIIDSKAHGQASFHLSKDGDELRYKLNVANIENVFMAHIHCGDPTVSGPVVVWLYPSTTPGALPPGGGPIQGRIASGTITTADLVHACATTLAALVQRLNDGTAYVNVHTNDGVAPTNTGPGDFPGGEVRGNFG